jgi:hypothetical protein
MNAHPPMPPPPPISKLMKATALAVVVAIAILITIILPAEYAIDPLGTGRWLGLTELAAPTVTPVEMVRVEGAPLIPIPRGPVSEYPAEFKVDVVEIALQPYEYVEYKYQLEKDATMLYSWQADAALIHDFHGERAGALTEGEQAEQSFDKRDRRHGTGSFVAPFAGIHGWYWENPGGDTITIRLASAGYYSAAVEIRSDRSRHPHHPVPLGERK